MRGFPIKRHAKGQSMVEYALIACLVAIAIGAAVVLTGPAVGNVFSNVISNASGGTPIYSTLNVATLNAYASNVAGMPAPTYVYRTNTPLLPTCFPAAPPKTYVNTLGPPNPPGTWQPGAPC
jgi:Flp pilus assembly pilin Flp